MMTRDEMVERLEKLAAEMQELGTAVDYYGGLADWASHGAQLVGAAAVVETWVTGLREVIAAEVSPCPEA